MEYWPLVRLLRHQVLPEVLHRPEVLRHPEVLHHQEVLMQDSPVITEPKCECQSGNISAEIVSANNLPQNYGGRCAAWEAMMDPQCKHPPNGGVAPAFCS